MVGMRLHRGMQSQEFGELTDGHDVALQRLFYLLVRCQNQRVPLGDFAARILEEAESPVHGMTKLRADRA